MSMSKTAACRAWLVAASIGAVEALKDQGVCRWNNGIRSLQQHAKSKLRSYSQAPRRLRAVASEISPSRDEKITRLMDFTCFGPTTTRF